MRITNALKILLPVLLIAAAAVANCTGDMSTFVPGGTGGDGEEVPPACDPDGVAPCPDDYFICVDLESGNKYCEGQEPAVPDSEGGWVCEVQGTTLICRGNHMPSGGDWYCREQDGEVICQRHAYVPAAEGADGYWDCDYADERLICTEQDGPPPGGDADTDTDTDTDSDSDIPGDGDDVCPPGVEIPSEEVCGDHVDNDCDGQVDEGCEEPPDDDEPPPDDDETPPDDDDHNPPDDGDEPPPGPPGCVCLPGATRYCDTPTYCQWGVQTCNPDGMEWGPCRETSIPLVCWLVSSWYSPEGEGCCIMSGMCCQDMWDLDFDGDTWESLGDCTDITCG